MGHSGAFRENDHDVSLRQSLSAFLRDSLVSLSSGAAVQTDHIEAAQHPSKKGNTKKLFLENETDPPWEKCKKCESFPGRFVTAQ
jgi:hypothetical protein